MNETIYEAKEPALSVSELIVEISKCLCDNLPDIKIEEKTGEKSTVININVARSDIGKIIGKQGSIISSIRTICENISAKNQKRVSVHIID